MLILSNLINSKRIKKNNQNNEKKDGSLSSSLVDTIKIKPTSKPVIELISNFKNINIDTFSSKEPQNDDELYITFREFIYKHRDGDNLPKAAIIESHLNIGNKKRKQLLKKAKEEGILYKPTENSYKFVSQ